MLFDKFTDTIFLKEDTDLEIQLNKLKELKNKNKYNENLEKDIKLIEYGIKGEKDIAFELKNSNIGMFVLHDIVIEYNNLKAQIDYIVVTKGYTYIIECKNLYGNITIDNSGQFTREYILNDKKVKEAIYSPYTQSVRHLDIIKKRWQSDHNKVITCLLNNVFDNKWYKPLVVLSNSNSILNCKKAPKEIRNRVVRSDKLIEYIKNDLKQFNYDELRSKKSMLELAESFLKINSSNTYDFTNKYNVLNNNLEEMLKEYRKNKSLKMNVPAYYIFTNEGLSKIISLSPKNLEELKKSNILSDIKIKCHGEEIIDIINNF